MTTSTGVVGNAEPGPISNSTDAAATYAATHRRNSVTGTSGGGARYAQPAGRDKERTARE